MENSRERICQSCGASTTNENLVACIYCGADLPMLMEINPKKQTLVSAYKEFFKRAFDFKGRSSRAAYWYVELMNVIISLVFSIVFIIVAQSNKGQSPAEHFASSPALFMMMIALLVYSAVLFVPSLSLMVRRLHDTNRSGLFALMTLTSITSIFLLVLLVQKGDTVSNRYGDPK